MKNLTFEEVIMTFIPNEIYNLIPSEKKIRVKSIVKEYENDSYNIIIRLIPSGCNEVSAIIEVLRVEDSFYFYSGSISRALDPELHLNLIKNFDKILKF